MNKLREILWQIMVGSATGHCEPKDLDNFVEQVKQWALSCLPEKMPIDYWWGKEIWEGCIDEIRKRIEEE